MGVKGFLDLCVIIAGIIGIKVSEAKEGEQMHCQQKAFFTMVNSKRFWDRAGDFLTQKYNQSILTAIVSFIGVILVSFIDLFKSLEMDAAVIFISIMLFEAILLFGKTSWFFETKNLGVTDKNVFT